MRRTLFPGLLMLVVAFLGIAANASTVPIATLNYDVVGLNAAEFDITNFTGPNSSVFPDTTFPVSTSVSLSNLDLTVFFASGPSENFGPTSGYFSLAPDGLSFNGTPLSTLNPITEATLTGDFSPTTITLNDGSTETISPSFTLTLTDVTGGPLQDQDFAIAYASTGGGPTVPEPTSLAIMASGLTSILFLRRRRGKLAARITGKLTSTTRVLGTLLAIACVTTLFSASAGATTTLVKLNTWTSPSSGAAGVTSVSVNGSGFPSGTILPSAVSISLAPTCGGAGTAATASKVTVILGSTERITFLLPSSLTTGNYFVSISGTTSTGNPFSSGTSCSQVQVTNTTPTLAACLPSSSLGVLSGKTTVTAYVPNGAWGSGTTGLQVVPLEGGGSPNSVSTGSAVNSCSSNSQTGETVCTANDTHVYLLTGTTLNNTLTSGANAFASFTGGSCENCGVAIDALTNTAYISMGISGAPSGQGVQALNLSNNTFSTPFGMSHLVSENISIDPGRGYILSPGEDANYTLLTISGTGALTEFGRSVTETELDSAAEDCTTGIALSTSEFTNDVFITDLTQATFTAGSPGTWTAPGQFITINNPNGFSAGTSGISVAPGTTHLGIVTGEFGGNSFTVFQLPSTSGSGTPNFVDYANAVLPSLPTGGGFSSGLDPHTLTAYTSPNDGKAYGVMANSPPPSYLAVIDLAALLAAPRQADGHTVQTTYDLITNGVVRYVATH